jgi:hypothetical protein
MAGEVPRVPQVEAKEVKKGITPYFGEDDE